MEEVAHKAAQQELKRVKGGGSDRVMTNDELSRRALHTPGDQSAEPLNNKKEALSSCLAWYER